MRCGKQRAQTAEVGSRHSRQAHTLSPSAVTKAAGLARVPNRTGP